MQKTPDHASLFPRDPQDEPRHLPENGARHLPPSVVDVYRFYLRDCEAAPHTSWASYREVAIATGLTGPAVKRARRRLVGLGILRVELRPGLAAIVHLENLMDVDDDQLADSTLSPAAARLLKFFRGECSNGGISRRPNRYITARLFLTGSQLRRARRELQTVGLIQVEQTPGDVTAVGLLHWPSQTGSRPMDLLEHVARIERNLQMALSELGQASRSLLSLGNEPVAVAIAGVLECLRPALQTIQTPRQTCAATRNRGGVHGT